MSSIIPCHDMMVGQQNQQKQDFTINKAAIILSYLPISLITYILRLHKNTIPLKEVKTATRIQVR